MRRPRHIFQLPKARRTGLQVTSRGLKVLTVDGPKIRDHTCVEFAAGGHGYVYSYVPKNQIWIEKINTRRDQRMVLAHELIEREYMKRRHWSYKRAHALANELENCLRQGSPSLKTFTYFLRKYGWARGDQEALRKGAELDWVFRNY